MNVNILTSIALSLSFWSAAQAQDSMDDVLSHRIISGWLADDGTYMAALELTLAQGWKTYWRSPGDAGIPPTFDWSQARNVRDVEVHWPSPEVFWQSGMRSVGYSDRVVLPLSVTPTRDGRDVRLRGEMDLGVCSDVCIPARLSIDAELTPDSDSRPASLVAALASVPYTRTEAGVKSAICSLSQTANGIAVDVELDMPPSGAREEAVVEAHRPGIWVSDASTTRRGDVLSVRAEMVDYSRQTFSVDRSQIRVTVIGSSYSVDVRGCTGR